ncbi:Ig-like domain-containing protein [Enterococcus sp. CWB-B31]|uniref:Ig-like domain-containing protein n=1 Tax=Enterococcus sp. CWB-B31 TaxID=2885159 RepID=UPI001E3CBB5C|nr:Ig-like domain-containing protein [Enterococcus sp. CWB-B31]MCB5956120.1 Ig-like domain-containing protein [Enterococcus sp. CWB-B31]
MKKRLHRLTISIIAGLVLLLFKPTVSFANENNDWIEYDVVSGTERVISFNEIQTDGLPESLEASPPVALKAAKTASGIGIIGEDDRVKVTDTTQYPYSAVVRTVATGNGHNGGQGSGALINSNLVLTCAHAVFNLENGFANVHVTPGNSTTEPKIPFGKTESKKVYIPKAYRDNPTIEEDIALIQLENSIGTQTGWMGITYFEDYYSYGNYTVTGYPGMFGGDMYTENNETNIIMPDSSKNLFTYFDVTTGNSGSPLYNSLNQIRGVIVSYANEKDETIAARATNIDFNRFAFINYLISKPVELKKIAIAPKTANLLPKKLETIKLEVSAEPENAIIPTIKWESSNPEIAVVDSNGVVSGIKEGISTITATTTDGNYTANSQVVVGDDHGNSYLSATSVKLGEESFGTIEYNGDSDLFFCEIDKGKSFIVISDTKPTQIARTNTQSGSWASGSSVRYTIEKDGLFYTANNASFQNYENISIKFSEKVGTDYSFKVIAIDSGLPVVNETSYTLNIGDSISLKAKTGHEVTSDLTYSVTGDNIPVDSNGRVVAVDPGISSIKIEDPITGEAVQVRIVVNDDHGNTFETATKIEIAGKYTGKIDYTMDVDWFHGEFSGEDFYTIKSSKRNSQMSQLQSNQWVSGISGYVEEDGFYYDSVPYAYGEDMKKGIRFRMVGTPGEIYDFELIKYEPNPPTISSPLDITLKVGESTKIIAQANNGLTKKVTFKTGRGTGLQGNGTLANQGVFTATEPGNLLITVTDPLSQNKKSVWVRIQE